MPHECVDLAGTGFPSPPHVFVSSTSSLLMTWTERIRLDQEGGWKAWLLVCCRVCNVTKNGARNPPSMLLDYCDWTDWGKRSCIPKGWKRVYTADCTWFRALSDLSQMTTTILLHCRRRLSGMVMLERAFTLTKTIAIANTKNNQLWDTALPANVLINCTVRVDHERKAGALVSVFKALEKSYPRNEFHLYILCTKRKFHSLHHPKSIDVEGRSLLHSPHWSSKTYRNN